MAATRPNGVEPKNADLSRAGLVAANPGSRATRSLTAGELSLLDTHLHSSHRSEICISRFTVLCGSCSIMSWPVAISSVCQPEETACSQNRWRLAICGARFRQILIKGGDWRPAFAPARSVRRSTCTSIGHLTVLKVSGRMTTTHCADQNGRQGLSQRKIADKLRLWVPDQNRQGQPTPRFPPRSEHRLPLV